ncbi:beta-lactamase [Cellulomonas bogoriensis 69B4 = DSM 16987]|uniref:Beta-lactamase n=1 Tax=Cellulomonas bogoriensis 69B4 = DSM 16987 TaxID=1386082 RepID=A0A0A0C0J0_9CELL|nr:beta-lactamase [Cellulomonas bogoriensis 69B4 = DSM 16987]
MLLLGLVLALPGCRSAAPEPETVPEASLTETPETLTEQPDVSAELQRLEEEFDARVGVSAVDTGTGTTVEHRAQERFGFASTLKLFAAAELLRQVPVDQRDARVTWTQEDVRAAGYSPTAGQHVADGLTLAELAEAAVRESDNTAMNLVLRALGGPEGMERALADLGDSTTRVVDVEPGINDADLASGANTTTPRAFTANLRALLEPQNLREEDLALLLDWMTGNATGDALVRAGAPAGWVVTDKSGGAGGIRNDVAVVLPPGRDPVLVTILTEKRAPGAAYDDALVSRTAATVLSAFE